MKRLDIGAIQKRMRYSSWEVDDARDDCVALIDCVRHLEQELEDSRTGHEMDKQFFRERCAELEEALRPLADCGVLMPDFVKDDEPTVRTGVLTAGQCRKAAEVLNRKGAQS
jgi:hypothetical protein